MTLRRHVHSPSPRRATLYLAMLALAPLGATAADLNYTLGVSILHSDNIALEEADPLSDTVVSPEMTFDITQSGSVLQFFGEGALRYPHYTQDTFDSELEGALSATLDWTVVPERISFQATNDLSRQSTNVLDNFDPGNQQQVNVFSAGPTFTARFNPVTTGHLQLLYTNTYAEDSPEFNGDRYSAETRVERRLNATDRLTVNAAVLQTRYDDGAAIFDLTRYDVFVGYASSLASFDIDVEAGYSQVKPRNYDGDSSSPLFRGNVDWRVGPRTTLNAGVRYEFSDAAQNLAYRRDPPGIPPVNEPTDPALQIGPQTFRLRRVDLGYSFESVRFSASLRPFYEQIRYLTAGSEDQDVKAVRALLDWRLRPSLDLSLVALRQKREYRDIFRNDTTTIVNLGLDRRFSRHWSGRLSLQRAERSSSSPSQSYTENSAMVTMTWRR